MAKAVAEKSKKPAAKKAITRDRAERRTREMAAREPAVPDLHPTRDLAGLQKIGRLMSGVANRAAAAYADARVAEGDKFVRIAKAGYQEALQVFEHILKSKKVLVAAEQELLITTMNNIKLLHIRVQDYNVATKDEAWRREHMPEWNPHPLGEDKQGFFAKETY